MNETTMWSDLRTMWRECDWTTRRFYIALYAWLFAIPVLPCAAGVLITYLWCHR